MTFSESTTAVIEPAFLDGFENVHPLLCAGMENQPLARRLWSQIRSRAADVSSFGRIYPAG
ncbi:hypothetical protein, partial [Nocardia sp. NPDC050789]|uniref:hypothetical protein n=1 Tax=Nocardia sp. NPDC050789 TaxID=3154841 RepID=UPI0033CA0401